MGCVCGGMDEEGERELQDVCVEEWIRKERVTGCVCGGMDKEGELQDVCVEEWMRELQDVCVEEWMRKERESYRVCVCGGMDQGVTVCVCGGMDEEGERELQDVCVEEWMRVRNKVMKFQTLPDVQMKIFSKWAFNRFFFFPHGPFPPSMSF